MTNTGTTGLEPYEYYDDAQTFCTSSNLDIQLYRAPWPTGRYVEIVGVRISNFDATVSGGHLVCWDTDLSNTTPTSVGSAALPRAVFGYPSAGASGVAATTVEYGGDGLPTPPFYAGIAFQSTLANVHIDMKVRVK